MTTFLDQANRVVVLLISQQRLFSRAKGIAGSNAPMEISHEIITWGGTKGIARSKFSISGLVTHSRALPHICCLVFCLSLLIPLPIYHLLFSKEGSCTWTISQFDIKTPMTIETSSDFTPVPIWQLYLLVVLSWGWFCSPGNIWQHPETSCVTQLGGEMLLASSGWKPGILLSIPQGTGSPWQQRIIWPQMPRISKLRKHDLYTTPLIHWLIFLPCSCFSSLKCFICFQLLIVFDYFITKEKEKK